jgi:hypothetical protein
MRSIFKWFTPPKLARMVDAGRVFCPAQQRDVDVDECLNCQFLDEVVSGNAYVSAIRCTPPSYQVLPESIAL